MSASSRNPESATRLSWGASLAAVIRSSFLGLARLSLVLLPTTMVGCVIEDPPPYSAPQQTPPRLDLFKADPIIDASIVRSGAGETVSITVPVFSEDAGEPLIANLLLDYDSGWNKDLVASDEIPAGTLYDSATEREIEIDWTIGDRVSDGCHKLTLLVTHVSNQNGDSTIPSPFKDDRDVAKAVWRLIIDPPGNETPIECL